MHLVNYLRTTTLVSRISLLLDDEESPEHCVDLKISYPCVDSFDFKELRGVSITLYSFCTT